MELKLLNKEELTALYQKELIEVFPHSELKPLSAMLRLMDMGRYDPLAVAESGKTVGYALMWLPENRKGALLEYFGVLRGLRGAGLGTKILALLVERYGQLFGEAEAPNSHDEEENDLRRRRIAFYERNGFRVLNYQCALFGVRFHCLYCGPESDDRKVQAMHWGVYAGYFSPEHMERYIQLPLAPGEAVKPAPEWVEEPVPPAPEDGTGRNERWLQWAVELQAIAQTGLFYASDRFDKERYQQVRDIAAEMLAHQSDLPLDKVKELFCCETGYQTAKLDSRAAIFQDGKILLVQENDGRWSLPGGWVDAGLSVKENTVKEVKEEAGLDVAAGMVIAVQDREKHNRPVYAHKICKIFVLCTALGGGFQPNSETVGSGYFGLDGLPPLAEEKTTAEQVRMCFEAYRAERWTTLLD